MAEDKQTQNLPIEDSINESDIFTIPEEFYGGITKRVVMPKSAVVSMSSSNGSAPGVNPTISSSKPKSGGNVKSAKWIIIGVIIFLILSIGGFSYYYIRQAQIAREKLQKPTPVPVNIPIPTPTPVPPVVEPTPTPEATSTPTPSPSAIFPSRSYLISADSDKDGLTDAEERLFGTDSNKPDTDSDGYLDSLEVENLYNPLGYKPVRLLDSGKIKVYLNPNYNYSIYYPSVWVAQSLDANNQTVMFSSDTGEFIEVAVVDNTLKLSVKDWYLAQSPGVNPADLKEVVTKEKVQGLLSPDGLSAYIPDGDKIYVINYNIGLKTEINFLTTFKMMVNSFRIQGNLEGTGGEVVVNTSTAVNPSLTIPTTSTFSNLETATSSATSSNKK